MASIRYTRKGDEIKGSKAYKRALIPQNGTLGYNEAKPITPSYKDRVLDTRILAPTLTLISLSLWGGT